jgi:hypothetical protein
MGAKPAACARLSQELAATLVLCRLTALTALSRGACPFSLMPEARSLCNARQGELHNSHTLFISRSSSGLADGQ